MTGNIIAKHPTYEFINKDFIGRNIYNFTVTTAMKSHCNESEHFGNAVHLLKIESCLCGNHKRKPIILIVSISLFLYIRKIFSYFSTD